MDESVGRDALSAVAKMLGRYPQVQVEHLDGRLEIKGSPGGFDIEVEDDECEVTIFAGSWHGHLSEPDDAAMFVAWLLSPRARLVTEYRGDKFVKSAVELLYDDGEWKSILPVEAIGLPVGDMRTEVLSNTVLSESDVPRR